MTELYVKMHTTDAMSPRSVCLPERVHRIFDREARKRRMEDGNALIGKLLSIIVTDNLFDAVLDDKPAKRRNGK